MPDSLLCLSVSLHQTPSVHENGVRVGAYIIGEFGHKISDKSVTYVDVLPACVAFFASIAFIGTALYLASASRAYPSHGPQSACLCLVTLLASSPPR